MNTLGWNRILLTAVGGLSAIYAVLVMGYVATTPDLGLRCLLDGSTDAKGPGLTIRSTVDVESRGPTPRVGDRLYRIDDQPTPTFVEFTQALAGLRNRTVGKEGRLYEGEDLVALANDLPSLVETRSRQPLPGGWWGGGSDPRWVRVEFERASGGSAVTTWLRVDSIPLGELVPTYVWFLFQVGILSVSAIAVWNRPFDRSAQLFLLMSALATFAFVGGFHWWVIAAADWLNLPFIVAGILLPAVTLHFFLVFPRPKPFLVRAPWSSRLAIYLLPVGWLIVLLGVLVAIRQARSPESMFTGMERLVGRIDLLRAVVRGYLIVAGVYFAATLLSLWHGFATTRSPIERKQVQWILGAALLATAPILYTVYLAVFSRVEFATGRGRLPMLVASLSFMLAYAVGIVRYKMMLAYQYVTRSALYYVVSSLLTLGLATIVTGGVLSAIGLPTAISQQQGLAIIAIVMLAVVLSIAVRDRLQGLADRHFFSEKYRLDEAFQRLKPPIGHEAETDVLGERLLQTCREVLRVDWAVFYLRNDDGSTFELVAADGLDAALRTVVVDAADLDALQRSGTTLRVRGESRDTTSSVQRLLATLGGDLAQAIEIERRVGGLVVLGRKQSAAGFTAEDATFLQALGQIASVGFYGSKVHRELAQLGEELRLKVDHAARQQRQIAILQAELESIEGTGSVVLPPDESEFKRDAIKGDGAALASVLETVRKVAATEATVLVRGESGTGKELLAQVVHDNSPRRSGPLVRVNCAALSPALLESELFGHVKGAFTGADRDRVGRFELAHGGTLFLDEIGDVSLDTQVKLLRVVQERCFERVGGSQTIQVDVRLVTATHRDLEQRIRDGAFREDLYYRLNVVSVTLPPLRERVDDLQELVFHFLRQAGELMGKTVRNVDESAWTAIEAYDWPGNIRELRNVIERAIVLSEGDTLTLGDLPREVQEAAAKRPRRLATPRERSPGTENRSASPRATSSLRTQAPDSGVSVAVRSPSPEEEERERLTEALRRSDGNKARAARLLGMPRSTYYSKLKKHGIDE